MSHESERKKLLLASGLRSWLRVPVWRTGINRGSLAFLHREPSRYSQEDAEVARRLADRVGRWQVFLAGHGALLLAYALLLTSWHGAALP